MMIPCPYSDTTYGQFKQKQFEMYHKKIDAILQNLKSNSLTKEDKRKLKNQLIKKLQKK